MKRRIRLVAVILLLCMLANLSTFPVSAKYFSDIYPGMLDREFFDAFNYVSDNGWIAGTDSQHFSPYESVTRAMFVAILYRYAATTETYSNSFTDVPANAYYYNAVGWAVHYDIVAGTSTTTFSPDATITKEQMASFLYRYAKNFEGKTYTPSTFASITAHPDYSSVSSYAIEAIRWAKTYHVFPLANISDYISPTANMNRAYAALFLANYSKSITGFVSRTRFHFNNSTNSFQTNYYLSSNAEEYLYDCLDDYYGTRTAVAQSDKDKIRAKIGTKMSGSCFGYTICLLFDKLGKIDFNKNFGGNAASLSDIGLPKNSPDTVESAINFYQFLHSVSDFAQHYRSFGPNMLNLGISSMYSYFCTYGTIPISYYWKRADGSEVGHCVLLTDMVRNVDNSFTLTIINPNSTNYDEPSQMRISVDGNNLFFVNTQLSRLIYYPAAALHFFDHFDLDGNYNTDNYTTPEITSNYADKEVVMHNATFQDEVFSTVELNNAVIEKTTTLILPYAKFRITNATGEELIYDGNKIEGDLTIYENQVIPNGPDTPADLVLRVDKSDYFVYQNLSNGYSTFSVISANGFGSICGEGLQTVNVNTNAGSIDVTGENMAYRVWLKIDVPNYEYFYLQGENVTSFTIAKSATGVLVHDINGLQKCGFTSNDFFFPSTTELHLAGNSTFDLAQIGSSSTILFSNSESACVSIALPTADIETEG